MRRSISTAVLVLLCLSMPACSRAAPKPRTTSGASGVTIAAYNVDQFYDAYDDPYTRDEANPTKPRRAIAAVAAAIERTHADVVAVSEVENEGVLKKMVRDFLPGQGYRYITAIKTNDLYGGNLGIISRLPIAGVTTCRWQTLRLPGRTRTWHFARGLMRVTLNLPTGKKLNIIIVHLKSRYDSPGDAHSRDYRLAEATELRRIVDDLLREHPKMLLAVAGDFNAEPSSDAMRLLLGDMNMVDVHRDLPPAKRITYLLPRYRSTIDYILASPALAKRLVPGSAKVLQGERLLRGSDHAPIEATFMFGS